MEVHAARDQMVMVNEVLPEARVEMAIPMAGVNWTFATAIGRMAMTEMAALARARAGVPAGASAGIREVVLGVA